MSLDVTHGLRYCECWRWLQYCCAHSEAAGAGAAKFDSPFSSQQNSRTQEKDSISLPQIVSSSPSVGAAKKYF